LLEPSDFTNYRATVHSLHVNVHVALIGKNKTYIFTFILTLSLIFMQFLTQLRCLHFCIQQDLSNFYLLVFYSERRNVILNGYVANWNSSGYFEVYHPVCKYCVKCLTKRSCCHLAKV